MNKKHKLVLKGLLILQWAVAVLSIVIFFYFLEVKSTLISLFLIVISHVIYRYRGSFYHKFKLKSIEKSYSELNRRNRRRVLRKIKTGK